MEESIEAPSLLSIQYISPSEAYPKTGLIEGTEDEDLFVPYTPLSGEDVLYLGRSANGVLALSTYRLYHQIDDPFTFLNLPLGLIEQIEIKDILHLHIFCKDARVCRLTFSSSEKCMEWMRRLVIAISPPKDVDQVFAFALHAWAPDDGNEELMTLLNKKSLPTPAENFINEVERLQFDVSKSGPWRISTANMDYRLCSTYPKQLLVPACISDQRLDAAAKFRSTRRVPAVVWRHRGNGAVIARCSQPEVGWLGWRSSDDEKLLRAIADACAFSSPENAKLEQNQEKKLLIMDARSYTTAVANRARGGGCECPEYYPNCDIQFMSLANIHAIRKSFSALRSICCPTVDQPNWFSLLEGTRWLHNMSGLLHAAITVASAIERDARPVLVHCSDGWDRTPQIVSLAELLLDPYYRTLEGFRVLVEREWLEFGHKFADRCGFMDDPNERCPVFLQWLDCVHNIAKQFPCAFEINSNYLVKLAQHAYSNVFGTFLFNNSRERTKLAVSSRTFSVWNFLQAPQYINHLYCSQDQVLWPSCNVRDLEVWKELYLGSSSAFDNLPSPPFTNQDNNANVDAEFMNGEDLNGNGEEQNGHLEEFSFRKNECVEDQTQESNVDSVLRPKWDNASTTDVAGPSNSDILKNEEVCNVKSSESAETGPSIDSSTETIVPSKNNLAELQEQEGNCNVQDSPSCSRQVPALLDPIDGLAPLKDDIQQRLTQMVVEYKAEKMALERELYTTRLALMQQLCHTCNHQVQVPDRVDDDYFHRALYAVLMSVGKQLKSERQCLLCGSQTMQSPIVWVVNNSSGSEGENIIAAVAERSSVPTAQRTQSPCQRSSSMTRLECAPNALRAAQ